MSVLKGEVSRDFPGRWHPSGSGECVLPSDRGGCCLPSGCHCLSNRVFHTACLLMTGYYSILYRVLSTRHMESIVKPVIAANKPVSVTLNADEVYYFCQCGRSSTQPFCDGSHRGTGLSPKAFTASESGEAALCQCKHSGNLPYCDGTHKRFSKDDVGKCQFSRNGATCFRVNGATENGHFSPLRGGHY